MSSIKVEETKKAAMEFYEKQQKLMKLMFSLTKEEHEEFHPWYMTYRPNIC
jgi:hypothetical protein